MTTQQRVARYRAKNLFNSEKTIEIRVSENERAILDALASQAGMSRVLYISQVLKDAIYKSGYFISGGKLHSSTS